jgi:hypothetical protein
MAKCKSVWHNIHVITHDYCFDCKGEQIDK